MWPAALSFRERGEIPLLLTICHIYMVVLRRSGTGLSPHGVERCHFLIIPVEELGALCTQQIIPMWLGMG